LFCFAASPNCPPPGPGTPNIGQPGFAPQAAPAAAAPAIQVQTTLTLQCRPTVFCPVTVFQHFCPVTFQVWCPPRTLSGVHCFTPFCPVVSAFCPPQQSIACGPGGFGGVPGF
jgi:hypothetical protein